VYKEDMRGGKIIKNEAPNLTTWGKKKTSKTLQRIE